MPSCSSTKFQDTTETQYDLVRAAFVGSTAVLTAVGDSKQRIMVWAGAMTDVFAAYQTTTVRTTSFGQQLSVCPELVRMQHVIAQALEAGTPPAKRRIQIRQEAVASWSSVTQRTKRITGRGH